MNLPFSPEFEQAMLDGTKQCTTRTLLYGRPGSIFTAFGKKFIIVEVRRLKLQQVAVDLFREEGFDSPQGFIDKWTQLHPRRKWQPLQNVITYFFKPFPSEYE